MTKFRISAHMLRIEKGRYKKMERHNRVCLICNHVEIEDIFHFMMECSKYRKLQNQYLYPILLHVNQGQTLSKQDVFIHILTSRYKDIVMNVANFIHKAFNKRNEHIVKKTNYKQNIYARH